jgi:hypothetical protein
MNVETATYSRRTVVVADRLAMRVKRLEAARTGHHGIQVMTFPQLAARLAGGFVQAAVDDALYRAVSASLETVDLGDLDPIRPMPGTPAATLATLRKVWHADLDLDARAGAHPRIAALRRLDLAVRSALPDGMLVLPALAQAARLRVSHAPAVLGPIECERLGDLAPCWRPLLITLASVTPVRWQAGARPIPGWLMDGPVEVVQATSKLASVAVVSASDAGHEAIEAMRWVRALLASGQARPDEIAIAAASTASFDEHFLALREQPEFDLHFAHGVPVAGTRAGQQAAALADVLVNGLTLPRLRRLARLCANAPLFARLPERWLRILPVQFAPRNAASWHQALASIAETDWPDGTDHGPDLRLVVDSLLAGTGHADALGPQVLKGQALSLWRRALVAGPPQALMANLATLRIDDDGEPCASVCWMPAAALAASPRPYVRLLGLNSGLWPRTGSEDRLLPGHIIAARELKPVAVSASERADFDAILGASARQVVLSHARRDSRGRHIGRSVLLQAFDEPERIARHAVPAHAMSESDRLLARPAEFRDSLLAVSAVTCWNDWHRAELTAHDGLVSTDHPALRYLAGRTQSASSLSRLLRYPLAYLWKYGLCWKVPDEGSDALVLDARLFGKLIHRIFELMLRAEADPAQDEAQRLATVMRLVQAEWESTQPTPPALIWRQTLEAARNLVEPALEMLRARERDMRLYAEVPFGGGDSAAGAELPWPNEAPIPIPGTGLVMKGYIDRLALSSDGQRAFVVDYKTGAELKAGTVLGGGTELQRSLYALAVRAMLGEQTTVHSSLLHLRSQAELVLEQPETVLDDLAGYLSLARTNLEAGHTVIGPDSGGTRDDYRLLLPALAQAVYCKKKQEAVALALGDAAAVWEAK